MIVVKGDHPMFGGDRSRAADPELKVGFWLCISSIIVIPIQLYSTFAEPERMELLLGLPWILPSLVMLVGCAIWGLVVCGRVFYTDLRDAAGMHFGLRIFWAIALLNIPYGAIAWYFLVHNQQHKSPKSRQRESTVGQ